MTGGDGIVQRCEGIRKEGQGSSSWRRAPASGGLVGAWRGRREGWKGEEGGAAVARGGRMGGASRKPRDSAGRQSGAGCATCRRTYLEWRRRDRYSVACGCWLVWRGLTVGVAGCWWWSADRRLGPAGWRWNATGWPPNAGPAPANECRADEKEQKRGFNGIGRVPDSRSVPRNAIRERRNPVDDDEKLVAPGLIPW